MAKVMSIVSPLPGVGIKVGSAVLRSTDPERRVWEASISVNLQDQNLDWTDFELGEYRTGLSAKVHFDEGHRQHLIWDMLTIALQSDETVEMRAFLDLAHPGSVQTILDTIAIEEEDFYGEGIDASTDRMGLYDDRRDYGISLWSWSS